MRLAAGCAAGTGRAGSAVGVGVGVGVLLAERIGEATAAAFAGELPMVAPSATLPVPRITKATAAPAAIQALGWVRIAERTPAAAAATAPPARAGVATARRPERVTASPGSLVAEESPAGGTSGKVFVDSDSVPSGRPESRWSDSRIRVYYPRSLRAPIFTVRPLDGTFPADRT